MCDDNWVNVAMTDDTLVIDLLLHLRHHPPPPPPPPPTTALNLNWSVRQRRSTTKSIPRKADSATRASPTTPLSWSAATSASGGAGDAIDDSHAETSRSKVANPGETATTKKSRRKKTLAELREEENLLLKERRSLKNELASLRLMFNKHSATNESLKRMKLDLESRQNSITATTSDMSEKTISNPLQVVEAQYHPPNSVSPETVTHKVLDDDSPVCAASVSSKSQEIGNLASTFVLPDLNLPVEDDLSSNAMH